MSNQTTTNPGHDRLWTLQEFCDYFGIEPKTAYNWRYLGYGPKSFKVGKFLRWRPEEIFRWEREQIEAENH